MDSSSPINIQTLTEDQYKKLPLVIRGESKEVRYAGDGLVVIKYLPTIYSFTHNRCGEVPGSDKERMKVTSRLVEVLKAAGIPHAYREVSENYILADLILPTETEYLKYNQPVFTPTDLTSQEVAKLSKAPPIEVVVKRFHTGTSKHRYHAMGLSQIRQSHPYYAGMTIRPEDSYPELMVRFDWRNPLEIEKNGILTKVQDEILPETLANWFIDVEKARKTALDAFAVLQEFMGLHDIIIYDLCLFITEDGTKVFGELSQDCGRYRHYVLGNLDKDVWRSGGSSEQVLEKWKLLSSLLLDKSSMSYGTPVGNACNVARQAGSKGFSFCLGTQNPYKIREFAGILQPTGCTLTPVPSGVADPEENGNTFADNAYIKAAEYAKLNLEGLTIGEDSGLCVHALGGRPGVISARYSGLTGLSRAELDKANVNKVLSELEGVPYNKRAANFTVALSVVTSTGIKVFSAESQCFGYISDSPRGGNGFGYDPIFIGSDTDGSTFAELDTARKSLRSHRKKVLSAFMAWLGTVLARREHYTIVVDGNDGTGKSTLVKKLQSWGYTVKDRGLPTMLTDTDISEALSKFKINGVYPTTSNLYIILDAPVEVSQERLKRAGKDLTEKYHNLEDLKYYRAKFLEVATHLPAFVVDATGDPQTVFEKTLAILLT